MIPNALWRMHVSIENVKIHAHLSNAVLMLSAVLEIIGRNVFVYPTTLEIHMKGAAGQNVLLIRIVQQL